MRGWAASAVGALQGCRMGKARERVGGRARGGRDGAREGGRARERVGGHAGQHATPIGWGMRRTFSHSSSSQSCLRRMISSAARRSCSKSTIVVPVSICASARPRPCHARLSCGWLSARWSSNRGGADRREASRPVASRAADAGAGGASGSGGRVIPSSDSSFACAPHPSAPIATASLCAYGGGVRRDSPDSPVPVADAIGPSGGRGNSRAASQSACSCASRVAQATSAHESVAHSTCTFGGAMRSCAYAKAFEVRQVNERSIASAPLRCGSLRSASAKAARLAASGCVAPRKRSRSKASSRPRPACPVAMMRSIAVNQ